MTKKRLWIPPRTKKGPRFQQKESPASLYALFPIQQGASYARGLVRKNPELRNLFLFVFSVIFPGPLKKDQQSRMNAQNEHYKTARLRRISWAHDSVREPIG